MRRVRLLATSLVAMLALSAGPAAAVQYGQPDTNNEYEWVGLMVAYNLDTDGSLDPMWRCTGSLIDESTFLTAGHCVGYDPDTEEEPEFAGIWFSVGPEPLDPAYAANVAAGSTDPCSGPAPTTGYPCAGYDALGTATPHPEWTGFLTIPQTYDIGLVTDLQWQEGATIPDEYGVVAPEGYLDDLAYERGKGNVQFTVVGYGLQQVKPVQMGVRQRHVATVSLVNLKSALAGGWNLHYSSNRGQGHGGSGGTCFGDSGGPVIHDGYIVGVNSFVLNLNCKGAGFAYRTDTDLAQDFIFGPD